MLAESAIRKAFCQGIRGRSRQIQVRRNVLNRQPLGQRIVGSGTSDYRGGLMGRHHGDTSQVTIETRAVDVPHRGPLRLEACPPPPVALRPMDACSPSSNLFRPLTAPPGRLLVSERSALSIPIKYDLFIRLSIRQSPLVRIFLPCPECRAVLKALGGSCGHGIGQKY
jgi:hypothetical protein